MQNEVKEEREKRNSIFFLESSGNCATMNGILYFSSRKVFSIFFVDCFYPRNKRKPSYQDVSSEKWSLPGSGVVVDGGAVVVSSAFNDLKWIAIKISKMRKPFDGKLLSFIAVLCVEWGKTAGWMDGAFMRFQWQFFICKLLFVQYQKAGSVLSSFS